MARIANQQLHDLHVPEELDASLPKGHQIRNILESIAAALPPGSPMPSERAIADHYAVARMTVRNEMARLANDGVVVIRPSAGAYVAQEPLSRIQLGRSFTNAMHRDGARTVGAVVLEKEVVPASRRLASLFRVDQDSPMLRVVRLRSVQGEPVGIERSTLPLVRFPGLDGLVRDDVSLYGILDERYGARRKHMDATARSELPDAQEAQFLDCATSDPCLVVTSLSRDESNEAFEVGRSTYRGDRYELTAAWDLE